VIGIGQSWTSRGKKNDSEDKDGQETQEKLHHAILKCRETVPSQARQVWKNWNKRINGINSIAKANFQTASFVKEIYATLRATIRKTTFVTPGRRLQLAG
jgi:hypothetical protein